MLPPDIPRFNPRGQLTAAWTAVEAEEDAPEDEDSADEDVPANLLSCHCAECTTEYNIREGTDLRAPFAQCACTECANAANAEGEAAAVAANLPPVDASPVSSSHVRFYESSSRNWVRQTLQPNGMWESDRYNDPTYPSTALQLLVVQERGLRWHSHRRRWVPGPIAPVQVVGGSFTAPINASAIDPPIVPMEFIANTTEPTQMPSTATPAPSTRPPRPPAEPLVYNFMCSHCETRYAFDPGTHPVPERAGITDMIQASAPGSRRRFVCRRCYLNRQIQLCENSRAGLNSNALSYLPCAHCGYPILRYPEADWLGARLRQRLATHDTSFPDGPVLYCDACAHLPSVRQQAALRPQNSSLPVPRASYLLIARAKRRGTQGIEVFIKSPLIEYFWRDLLKLRPVSVAAYPDSFTVTSPEYTSVVIGANGLIPRLMIYAYPSDTSVAGLQLASAIPPTFNLRQLRGGGDTFLHAVGTTREATVGALRLKGLEKGVRIRLLDCTNLSAVGKWIKALESTAALLYNEFINNAILHSKLEIPQADAPPRTRRRRRANVESTSEVTSA